MYKPEEGIKIWRSIVMWVGGTHYNQAPMSEGSKEPDLRPGLPWVRIPLGAIPSCIWVKYTTFSYSVVVITLDFEHVNTNKLCKYLYGSLSKNLSSNLSGRILLAFML